MKLPAFSAMGPARLVRARAVAEGQALLEVAPVDGFVEAYARPGQFCQMGIGETVGIFAMFSTPGETIARFLVRTDNPEGGEAAAELAELAPSTAIAMSLPAGDGFPLERARGRDVHFVATGTGVAPIHAAIETVLREPSAYGKLSLDYGLKSPAHCAIEDAIARWRSAGLDVEIAYSEVEPDGALSGRTVQDGLRARKVDFERAAIIAVGQSAMIESLRVWLALEGGSTPLLLNI